MMEATQMILGLEDWCNRETYWPRLLQGGVLFEGLHALVGQHRLPPDLPGWLEDSQKEFPQDLKRYEVARALVCCAQLAAAHSAETLRNPGRSFGALDEALNALKDMPPGIPSHRKDWAAGCIHSFLTPPQWPHGVDMPVAMYDKTEHAAQGLIGTLRLEIAPNAMMGLSQHPRDTLMTGFDGFDTRFIESMHAAWEAAQALARSGQAEQAPSWRGRWQLSGPDGQPLKVSGASASGAAVLGWYHALTHTRPDPGVIVLARIDPTGALSEVDGISEKVAAIVAENERRSMETHQGPNKIQLLDTLAVAGAQNRAAAETALQKHDKSRWCRVVSMGYR